MLSTTDLLAPIPGANPAGAHLRYEPLYDQIKEARREEDDLPQGDWQTTRKTADWAVVIRLTSEALAKKSKDLQLAAWLTEALLKREGIGGLRQAIELLLPILQQFWDGVYPELDEGDAEIRAAPLEWIGMKLDMAVRHAPVTADRHSLIDYRDSRRVPTREEAEADSDRAAVREQAVAEGKLTPDEFEASFAATPVAWYRALVDDLDATLAALQALDDFCRERFGDVAPSFMPLRDALKEVRQLAGQLLARKEPQAAVPDAGIGDISLSQAVAAGQGVAAPLAKPRVGAAAPASAGMPAGAPRTRDEAAAWIAAAATHLRRDRPTDPASYLMVRGFRWGELRAGGGSVDPRQLVAPSTEVRTQLRGLLLDGRWPELLDAAETALATACGRGWLDLQRYALTACDGLGADYDAVGRAIRGALRSVLADVPDLPTLTLMDDAPTANAQTIAWLRAEGMLDGQPQEEPVVGAGERRRPTGSRDPYDVARERLRMGDARGAMELLMREATQEKSARARFLRRTQAAEMMVEAGLEPVALPILHELLGHIDAHKLEEWEAGETVAQPLTLLYRCVQRVGADAIDPADLYVRICRLDPLQAIQLGDSNSSGNEGA
jgi:type VI secretion system protein ImpA